MNQLDKLIRMFELGLETTRAVKHGTMTVRVDEMENLLSLAKDGLKLDPNYGNYPATA